MPNVISWTLTGLMFTLPLAAAPAFGQAQTPKPGSPVRRLIMDSLRVPIERELRQPVIFKVKTLRVLNGWAFLDGDPVKPNGKAIDYSKTKYREQVQQGMFGGGIFALLHKRGGAWRVTTYALGPTDVTWIGWDKEYHAPAALFPKH